MKKLKSLKLMMLSALVVLGTMSASAQALKGTTQYDTDGFKYKILSCEDATEGSTVEVSQNVYSTQGAAALTIKDEVSLYVKGTNDKKEEIDKNVTFKVTSIAANGFENVKAGKDGNVTAIVIGANIAKIGNNAFDGCTNVTSITFSANENDMTIGDYAFRGTKPTKLDLTPIAGTLVANKWFGDFVSGTATNSSLTEIKFNAKLTKIVAEAFAGFTGLEKKTSIVFPETGLTGSTYLEIEAGAFKETPIEELDLTEARIQDLNPLFEYNNVTLKKVYMAKTVVTLKENALADCIQLADVDFSKSTKLTKLEAGSLSNTIVDTYDFSNCYEASGTPLDYTSKLDFTVGANPFVNTITKTNKNLTTVKLPKADDISYSPVTVISTVFANCEKLRTITNLEISKVTEVVDKAFENDINLTELTFPALKSVAGSPFVGCTKLTKLTFDGTFDDGANVFTLGNGTNIYGADDAVLQELYITVPAVTGTDPKNVSKAVISANALKPAVKSGLTKIEIAKDGVFSGTINKDAIVLKEDANAEVTFGDINDATFNTITGPKGVNTTTLTMGAYTKAKLSGTNKAIVDGTISAATVGAVAQADVLDAIGQAKVINFAGNITVVLTAPTTANAALTTLNFNKIDILDAAIAATVFDDVKAPALTTMSWLPEGDNVPAAGEKPFDKNAFWKGSVARGAEAVIKFTTNDAVAKLYGYSEANLYNVIFSVTKPESKPEKIQITALGKEESTGFYYGKVYVPKGKKYAFKKETAKEKGDIVVYSAFVDSKDQKIYMDPLAIVDGEYVADEENVVIVRIKDPQTVTAREKDGYEFVSDAICEETDHGSTMRSLYIGKWQVYNHLQMTTKVFSSDYIGTTYVGKTLYAMGNPAIEGKLLWKKIDVKSYLPKDAVFVVTEEQPASASELEVVWLDGTENVTGIIERLSDEQSNENGAVYNLQGVRVSNAQKGIYIKNGKKFIVK